MSGQFRGYRGDWQLRDTQHDLNSKREMLPLPSRLPLKTSWRSTRKRNSNKRPLHTANKNTWAPLQTAHFSNSFAGNLLSSPVRIISLSMLFWTTERLDRQARCRHPWAICTCSASLNGIKTKKHTMRGRSVAVYTGTHTFLSRYCGHDRNPPLPIAAHCVTTGYLFFKSVVISMVDGCLYIVIKWKKTDKIIEITMWL